MSFQLRLFDNTVRAQAFRTGRPKLDGPLSFHRRLPGYGPTPLVKADTIAESLGVGALWVKDESDRLGLPSFKVLGASWAVCRSLVERLSLNFRPSLEELRSLVAPLRPLCLAAATDGNHGRAVARMAALLGLDAHIFVPTGTVEARIASIELEGAVVTIVEGDYDDAVRASAEDASDSQLVISDTSWHGYERVPRWIIEGYATIHHEVAEQLAHSGSPDPEIVAVQIGVGAFAASVVEHYRSLNLERNVALLGVEPLDADCLRSSMVAGQLTSVPGPHSSMMAGLNCGTPSLVAWPIVSGGVDVFVAIDDDASREAIRLLAGEGIVAGESGAAGLAGLIRMHEGGAGAIPMDRSKSVVVFSTEGATDPRSYEAIVGRSPEEVRSRRDGG